MSQAIVTTPTLYDIEVGLLEALARVEDLQRDPAHDPAEITVALEIVEIYLKESAIKREKVGRFLAHLDMLDDQIDTEIERLKARKDKLARAKDQLSKFVLLVMSRIGEKKLEAGLFTFKSQKNPPRVVIDDPLQVPASFLVQPDPPPPTIDKKAIKKEIEAGKQVPGAHLEQSSRLVVE